MIIRLANQYAYLHDCNGGDLQIGKQLGADQVLVSWVDRVSGLMLSLTKPRTIAGGKTTCNLATRGESIDLRK